jgi:hypothetical protein
VLFETRVTQSVHRITLNQQGGSGGSTYFVAVNGRADTITKPNTRTGYDFAGYYTGANGSGTLYYDASGKKVSSITHSNYSANTVLYAKWNSWTYKAKFLYGNFFNVGISFSDGSLGSNATTYTYGSYSSSAGTYVNNEYQIKDFPTLDGPFNRWELNGNVFSRSKRPYFTGQNTGISSNGQTIEFIGYCDVFGIPQECIALGSLITLSDRTVKPVELLDGSEEILVWSKTGFASAPILFIDSHGYKEYEIVKLRFSDGSFMDVIDQHGLFDITTGRYEFISKNNASAFIRHSFQKQYVDESGNLAWKVIQLTGVEIKKEFTNAYSPVTAGGYLCYYVNGILTAPAKTDPFINAYEIDRVTLLINESLYLTDIEMYGLYTYKTFIEAVSEYLYDITGEFIPQEYVMLMLPEVIFEAFRGEDLKVSLAKGNTTWDEIFDLIQDYSKFFGDIDMSGGRL